MDLEVGRQGVLADLEHRGHKTPPPEMRKAGYAIPTREVLERMVVPGKWTIALLGTRARFHPCHPLVRLSR